MAKKSEKISEATRLMIRRALTKYKPSYVGELIDYFMSPATVEPGQESDTSNNINWKEYLPVYRYLTAEDGTNIVISTEIPVLIPTKMGFCKRIGISLSTFYAWCQTYPEFRAAWIECREWQIELIENYATAGVINPSFAKYRIENYISGARQHPIEALPGTGDDKENNGDTGGSGDFRVTVTVLESPGTPNNGEGVTDAESPPMPIQTQETCGGDPNG